MLIVAAVVAVLFSPIPPKIEPSDLDIEDNEPEPTPSQLDDEPTYSLNLNGGRPKSLVLEGGMNVGILDLVAVICSFELADLYKLGSRS